MCVARILATKGAEVYATHPQQSLQDVAAELVERGIGALVVLDFDGAVVGLIGERDVIAAVARHGAQALQDPVSRHMTRACTTVREEDTIDDTMETMTMARCRHLPVLRDGRLVGLVSIGDVVKYRIDSIDAERLALREYIATA